MDDSLANKPTQGSLAAALAKIANAQSPPPTELPASLKKIAEAQGAQSNLAAALARIGNGPHFDSVAAARRAGMRDGFRQIAPINLNPWMKSPEVFRTSPMGELQQDWRRLESDIWATVAKLREQLDELPKSARDRLSALLAQHLQSRTSA